MKQGVPKSGIDNFYFLYQFLIKILENFMADVLQKSTIYMIKKYKIGLN